MSKVGISTEALDAVKMSLCNPFTTSHPVPSETVTAIIVRLNEAERLLRWYVESDLVEAGDEFGQWDDEVRGYVGWLRGDVPQPNNKAS